MDEIRRIECLCILSLKVKRRVISLSTLIDRRVANKGEIKRGRFVGGGLALEGRGPCNGGVFEGLGVFGLFGMAMS